MTQNNTPLQDDYNAYFLEIVYSCTKCFIKLLTNKKHTAAVIREVLIETHFVPKIVFIGVGHSIPQTHYASLYMLNK